MELKSPSKDEVGAENAYNQIRNYLQDIPSIFYYNAICVISDLSTNKAGTITSGLDRFMEWKTKDGSYENTAYAQFDTFYEGLFEKARLLDIIKNFICFSESNQQLIKILAGYHQYFAVKKLLKKQNLQLLQMVRVVFFGILRVAGNRYQWFFMHIYCKKFWIARQSS